jgi:predicted AAA+ superfamily ATPase
MYYNRFIRHLLDESLKDTPVVFINGPRQVGKSTLVQEDQTRNYYTLDDFNIIESLKTDPFSLLSQSGVKYTLDEIQRVPEIFLSIKQLVDRNRIPGKFILTGSANVMLLPKIAESLAGRMEILHLYPLSVNEIQGEKTDFFDELAKDSPIFQPNSAFNLDHHILMGGYPEVVARGPERRPAWFESYLMAILQRDIKEIAHIEQVSKVPQLLKLLACRVSSILNFGDLSRAIALSASTLQRYYVLLETLFLVHRLTPFSDNLGKRLVKSPKLYFYDTGLLSHLLGLTQGNLRVDLNLFGHVFENFVVQELLKMATWSKRRVKFHYYRDHSQNEVDLLLELDNSDLIAIEIKATSRLSAKDLQGIETIKSHKKFKKGYILYLGEEVLPLGESCTALPISVLFPQKMNRD